MALSTAVRAPAARRPGARVRGTTHRPSRPAVRGAGALPAALVTTAGPALTGLLVVALLVGGGAPEPAAPGLPDAGPVTGWGRPVVDLAVRALAVLTVGQLAYAALLAPPGRLFGRAGASRALRGTAWSGACWLLAEVAALALTTSALYGIPLAAVSPGQVVTLLTLPVGRASLVVALLVAVVVAGASLAGRRDRAPSPAGAVALLLAALGAVVVPVVLSGHSAAAADHVPAVLTLSVHVVTASLWVGGLAGLLLHGRTGPVVVVAVRRFSTLALGCVVLLTASGVAAALLVAGAPSRTWTGEGWVWLLLAKTVLLGALVTIGWWHRSRALPHLAAGRPRSFLRLAVVEVGVMAATVTVSVALAAAPTPSAGSPHGAATSTPATQTEGPVVDHGAAADASSGHAPADPTAGHDHGELSVSVLIDAERFHVAGTVRPSQPVTVYNSSDSAATITAVDGSFHAEVPAGTFITFEAPSAVGDHPFVSRVDGADVAGYRDVLRVRAGD